MKILQFPPERELEIQIGFLSGMMLGIIASWIFIMFFTDWQWYFKLASSIGEISIIGYQALGIINLIESRKNILESKKQLKEMNNDEII